VIRFKTALLMATVVVSSFTLVWANPGTEAQSKLELFSELPLVFEPNRGQAQVNTEFMLHDAGLSVSFRREGVRLFSGDGKTPLLLRLKGVQPQLQISGEDLLSSHSNYLIGNNPAKWHTGIPNYGRVRYRGLYKGIDLLFYGNGKHLEHDFIVEPGADPREIRIGLEGAARVKLRGDGSAWLETKSGWLVFQKPIAYQETLQGRKPVEASFVLQGRNLSFHLGSHDKSIPLVIDPVLVYSTYVTGPKGAVPAGIAVDSAGNAYITGYVFATDFPMAAPPSHTPFQPTCKSCPSTSDVFVTKLSADGASLVYSTYLGGSDYDQPFSIAVDGNGNALIGGRTNSTDFPTQPLVTPSFTFGHFHGFITSLNATGDGLNWSNYSGGTTGDDSVFAVAVDQSNNAYASGLTDSTDFPMTAGTLPNPSPAYPVNDVFAIKFNSSGATLFSAILGHNGSPSNGFANSFAVGAMTVDSSAEPIIVGSATPGIPTTQGSFQPAPNAAPNTQNRNVFIVKLAADASSLVFGTYLGGSGGDTGSAVALDSTGNIYVAGSVGAGDFPTTPGAFQTKFANSLNCCGAFLSKLDPTGSSLIYSTFLGGTAASFGTFTSALSVAVDSTGNAYVAGDTRDTSFPLVNPLKSSFPSSSFGSTVTAFASQFDTTASHLLFSTIFSGSAGTNLPTTPGAFQTSNPVSGANVGAPYIAKLDPAVAAASVCLSRIALNFPDTKVGLSNSLSVNVANCGNANLTFSSISVPAGVFQVQSDQCSAATVTAGTGCSVTILFQPTATGLAGSTLTIIDSASIGTQKVSLSGRGVLPQIAVPASVAFDPALGGTTLSNQQIFVENVGTIPANIASVKISATDFAIISDTCSGVALQVGNACFIGLSFTPSAPGPLSGSVTIQDDAVGNPQTVQLTGTGVSSYPVPSLLSANPRTILAGSGPPILVVSGSGFFPASILRINGVDHVTTYLSASQISAAVNASEIASMGEDSVTVFNPAPGGGESSPLTLTIYTTISLSARNIVYEPFTEKIYAALSNASASPNSVVAVDPFTGQVGTPKTVGTQPRQMAVSGDGQFLYIGLDGDHALGRLNLYTGNLDPATTLGSDALTGAADLRAQDIQVVPGDPHTAAVSVSRPASPSEGGVDLIRDGVLTGRLDNAFPSFISPDSIGFASDPTQFFGSNGNTYYTFGISPTALSLVNSHAITVTGDALGTFVSDGTRFYTNSGRIVDPVTGNIIATIPTFTNFTNFAQSVVPATDTGRLFFDDLGGTFAVFDSNSLQQTGQVTFQRPLFAGAMVRWGSNGFAIDYYDFTDTNHANDHILLFRTSLAFPGSGPSPVPTVSALSPSSANPSILNFVLTVNGANFVPGAVVHWNGAERTTTFVSASQLLVKIPGTDILVPGTAQVSVANPGPVESTVTMFAINGPTAKLSPNTLSFAGQPVGGSSASQAVTLTNSGNASLTVGSISATGGFSTTNNCGTSLGAGLSCTINVTFTPSATGSRNGTLTVADNASGSPQQVALSGSATDFQLGTGPGGTTATVQSGQTATYNLSLTGNSGFTGTVTLSCSGVPVASACNVNPSTIAVSGTNAVSFTTTVSTTARTAANFGSGPVWAGFNWLAVLALLPLMFFGRQLLRTAPVRKTLTSVIIAIVLVLGVASCGGGGGNTPPPPLHGTPPGTYSLVLTASSSGATRQMQLTLVVQ
jgi:Abnormal spindle-like microcephaly-assoc'd, ASPM-SPD-2-Hydin/Beta-propeller repeat